MGWPAIIDQAVMTAAAEPPSRSLLLLLLLRSIHAPISTFEGQNARGRSGTHAGWAKASSMLSVLARRAAVAARWARRRATTTIASTATTPTAAAAATPYTTKDPSAASEEMLPLSALPTTLIELDAVKAEPSAFCSALCGRSQVAREGPAREPSLLAWSW